MKILTIGFSTVYNNFETLQKKLVELNFQLIQSGVSDFLEILVVVQYSNQDTFLDFNNTHYIFTSDKGLSKSRNKILEESKSSNVWFLDDDVIPKVYDIKCILESINSKPADIWIGQIGCSDCFYDYKDYSKSRKGKLGLLRVSSIEIIVNRFFVLNAGIKFNEKFGLGTLYPIGEENFFLLDLFDFSPYIYYLNFKIIEHPCFEEKREFRTNQNLENILIVKGILARRIGGLTGLFLVIFWSFKFFYLYKKKFVVPYILKGYFIIKEI